MKIALIVAGGVDKSGVSRVVPCLLWLIERLVRDGDEVHVFAFCQEETPGTWPLLGATIHNAGRSILRLFVQIAAEHRRSRFDVIHSSWSAVANLAAVAARAIFRIPMLLYFGGGDLSAMPDIGYGSLRSRKGRMLLRLFVAGADRIAGQSAPVVARARALGISAQRLPLGVALDKWPAVAPLRRPNFAPLRLLHVGGLNPVKDHAMLLDTAVGLKQLGVDFELDSIGADIFGDGRIQQRAELLGLSGQVRFHGFLQHDAIRPWFDRANILVVTSRHEAGPIAALEAAIAGLAVVGTNVGHLAEWAPDAARVVAPRDSAALARVIADLSADEAARLNLAEKAQIRALAENADATTQGFRQVYAEMSRR